MKVLLVSPKSGVVGGISIWTKNIMSHMEHSPDVEVELCDFSRTIAGQMIKNPLKKWALAIRDYLNLTKETRQQIDAFDGDAVHICTSASLLLIRDILLLKAASKKGLKTIVHFHFGRIPQLFESCNWECKLIKKVMSLANMAVVMDMASYNTLKNAGYANVTLLPNPISDDTKTLVDGINVEREERTILFAGHCIPTKGIFELVEACKEITCIKLKMVGAVSSEMRRELLHRAGRDNSWLDVMGQLPHDQTIREMCMCDIFVLPTYTEGFPNVILESMTCGCPIVASSVGAIPEMLEDENDSHYGIIIPPKDVRQLRHAIDKFLSDKSLKTECGINAKKRVFKRYGMAQIAKQLTAIWNDCVI